MPGDDAVLILSSSRQKKRGRKKDLNIESVIDQLISRALRFENFPRRENNRNYSAL
jgi:hypothetical protein